MYFNDELADAKPTVVVAKAYLRLKLSDLIPFTLDDDRSACVESPAFGVIFRPRVWR